MKIQANDLRGGNWIYDAECAPHYFQVECIYQNLHGKYWVSYRDESIKSDIGEVVHIKLTEEILLKCGFENNGKNRKYKAIGCNLEITGTGNYIRYWLCGGKSIILTHLHQLQNLVHSLKGEELTVKL